MSKSSDKPEHATALDTPAATTPSTPTADEVRAYLHAHPTFIANDPDLLASLVPPSHTTGQSIVDMQRFMISRLQKQVRNLKDIQSDLIDAASVNALTRDRVHEAALRILDAPSFAHLIDYITRPDGLARTLGVCTVALAVENETAIPGIGTGTVRLLDPGGVLRLMGGQKSCRLAANIQGSQGLYGPIGVEVCSEAFLRLDISTKAPSCLLAFGSREPYQFHLDQAYDLLDFLGDIMERCIRLWLNLPADI